jgi:hypothetical protein
MDNQESSQPKSGQGGCWGCWFMAVLGLGAIFPPVGLMVLLLSLLALCIAYRWAAVLLGLALAVTCAIGAIVILADPKMGDAAWTGLLLLPWAGFGLWLAAGGLSKKHFRSDGD